MAIYYPKNTHTITTLDAALLAAIEAEGDNPVDPRQMQPYEILLIDAACRNPDWDVRAFAIQRVSDIDTLAERAQFDENPQCRKNAITRLKILAHSWRSSLLLDYAARSRGYSSWNDYVKESES